MILAGDGKRITVERGFLADSDWALVRERIESMLSGRFDLTVWRHPQREFNVLRVMGLWVPSGVLTLVLIRSLLLYSPRLAAYAVAALGILMMGAVLLCLILLWRESERCNPTWRAAKPKTVDWADWSH